MMTERNERTGPSVASIAGHVLSDARRHNGLVEVVLTCGDGSRIVMPAHHLLRLAASALTQAPDRGTSMPSLIGDLELSAEEVRNLRRIFPRKSQKKGKRS